MTANNAVKTYDGNAYAGGNGVVYAGFVNGETQAVLGGAVAYGGTAQGAINAGPYVIAPSGLSSSNYDITFANGTLTVNQLMLTLGGITVSNKTYDGTTAAAIFSYGSTLASVLPADSGNALPLSAGSTDAKVLP